MSKKKRRNLTRNRERLERLEGEPKEATAWPRKYRNRSRYKPKTNTERMGKGNA